MKTLLITILIFISIGIKAQTEKVHLLPNGIYIDSIDLFYSDSFYFHDLIIFSDSMLSEIHTDTLNIDIIYIDTVYSYDYDPDYNEMVRFLRIEEGIKIITYRENWYWNYDNIKYFIKRKNKFIPIDENKIYDVIYNNSYNLWN